MIDPSASLPPCEISWFSALCDDDYEFLGVPDPALKSSWEHCRDIVMQAETAGYDNILLPSGYTLGIDTTAFAAGIAPMLKRLRLLMAVRIGESWPPQLARQIATIDQMLGGRLAINIISSDLPGETLASAPRYARTVEAMHILRTLLDGKPLDHDGDFWKLKLDPPRTTTVSGRCPALYFGGLSEAAREAAATNADVYLMWPDTMDGVRAIIADLRARAARHGRTLRFGYPRRGRSSAVKARRCRRPGDPRAFARFSVRRRPSPGRTARGIRRWLCRGESVDRDRPRTVGMRCRDRRRSGSGARQAQRLPGRRNRCVHPVGLSARRRGRPVRTPRAAADRAWSLGRLGRRPAR
jgi:alkanesulfonate monooxygenase SsuD/methylene tetrahydromethanopterin reductase-like flavin-dependent oxidoreductase (luciferase family)